MKEPTPPPRPAVGPVVVAYAIAFVLVIASSAALVFGVAAARAHGRMADANILASAAMAFATSAPGVMAAAALTAAVFSAVAVALARAPGRRLATTLRWGPTRATWAGVLAAIFGTAGLSLAAGALADVVGVRHRGNLDQIAGALAHASPSVLALALLTVAAAPAAAEETFFRGFMQTRLVARFGRWPGIVLAALAFGLIHLDPVQGSLAMGVGLFLGWTTERFGGVRPSVVAHGVNNALFIVAAAVGSGKKNSHTADVAAIVTGGAIVLTAAWVLRSHWAQHAERPRTTDG